MFEFFGQLFALAKLPRIALIAAIASAVLIFAPPEWLALIGVERVKENWRSELGIVLVVSAAVLIAQALFFIVGKVSDWWNMRAWRSYLHKLTDEEQDVLAPYILEGLTSQQFEYTNGVVQGLVARKILYRSANMSRGFTFPYNLQLWAREYLEQNRHLLDGAMPPRRPDTRPW